MRVYPRVCGGTSTRPRMMACPAGLSPRVRGNPAAVQAAFTNNRVYPRVCGGTLHFVAQI